MGEEVSNEVLAERLANLKETQVGNHAQNRRSIHSINKNLQGLADEIWKIKIKMAVYSAGAGVVTTAVTLLAEHIIKSIWK